MSSTERRVALITGAGGRGGIGRAIAKALAGEGVALALSDVERDPETLPPDELDSGWRGVHSAAEELGSSGAEARAFPCDLRDADAIDAMVDKVLGAFGRIDILVNNARALMGQDAVPVTELTLDVWQTFLDINTTAPFLLMRAVGRHMTQRGGGGRIISIGSDMSKRALPDTAAYAASKFGLIGLTQACAMDLAPYAVTVNAVCPGPVRTNRFNYAERARAEASGEPLDVVRERGWDEKARDIPTGRATLPEEVADLVAYLASDRAAQITGQAFNVNGGMFFH